MKMVFLTQKPENYYLLPDEDEPHRTCKRKNYIPRIMFLCVTARPRFRNGQCIFYGKISCFPLVTYEHAQRRSVNRPAGTLVVKPITSITRDVIRDFMINKVLPAIREKWSRKEINQLIFIQQDNVPSHLEVNDPVFCEAAKQGGFDIRLIGQPPNSPDMNILDLGFLELFNQFNTRSMAKQLKT
jgi:hypothetical protein